MASTGVWWRVTWMEAVWSSELKPLERLVAAVYADHAKERRVAWVTLDRLCGRTGLSRDAANRAVQGLEGGGWLMSGERKPRRPVTFWLVIPDGTRSTGDGPVASTPDGPRSDIGSTSPDIGSTPDALHPSSYPSAYPSLSPAQQLVGHLLGINQEDERLTSVDKMLADNGAQKPAAWIRRCHENGDLATLLEQAYSPDAARRAQEMAADRKRCRHGVVNGRKVRGQCPTCWDEIEALPEAWR